MVRAAIAILLLLVVPSAAHAQKRIALLIGNQGYASEIGVLVNPHNDVALLERTLRQLGFQVTTVRDASLSVLHQAVNQHVRLVRGAGTGAVGFLYYSGHGAADATTGINYLIPVDVKSAEDSELWDFSLRLTDITRKLKGEAGNATHFVVFDACRNVLKIRKAGTRTLLQSKGFVPVANESGMLIAYATAEGELASDRGEGAGPYAKVLAEEIVRPGVEAVVMFRAVQRRVRAAVGQEPYIGFNALGDVYLAGLELPKPATVAPAPAHPAGSPPSHAEVVQFCQSIATNPSFAVVESLLDTYKGTPMEACAKARLDELKAQQVAVAAPSPATQPAQAPTVAVHPTPRPARCDGVEALVGSERQCLKPRDTFRDCPECPEMVVVPAGSFLMGSSDSEADRGANEGPQRKVTIARPLAVGRFEVTFAEWDACVADSGWFSSGGCTHKPSDNGWGRGNHPVINVSWNHITKEYLPWLSRKAGKTYRLLSEAEWEYAARAGTTTRYVFGDTITKGDAQYSDSNTVEVGSFAANAFGLHDMFGNVGEWVQDCWHDNYQGAPIDGTAWTTGNCSVRVLRGGSWNSDPRYLRSAFRVRAPSASRYNVDGFRLARTP